jgi:hypothetical protein
LEIDGENQQHEALVRSEWGEVARRGECSLHVMTLARARQEGLGGLIHREAAYIALLEPDSGQSVYVNFTSLAAVAAWIGRMQPHDVTVAVANGEDEALLKAALAVHVAAPSQELH